WNLHTRTSIETRNGSLRDFLIPNRVDLFSSAAEIAAVSAGLDGNESPQPGISPLCQKPVKCCDLPDNYNPEVGRALAVPRMKLADEAGVTQRRSRLIQSNPLLLLFDQLVHCGQAALLKAQWSCLARLTGGR